MTADPIDESERTRPRALIYARVSLDMTGEGRSVARQLDACRSLSQARDYEVVGEEMDTQSAYASKARPGWERVKAAAARGEVDVIVAWQLDRVTRSMRELEQLIELTDHTGVAVATVSGEMDLTTANGRLLARILGAVARAESEMKGARQRLANLDRAKRGIPRLQATQLFGYDTRSNVIPAEAREIQRAARDFLNGSASLKVIQERWNAAGLLPHKRTNGPPGWTPGGVRELLINPRLAGLAIHKGQVVGRGTWRPILKVSTHERLKAVVEQRRLSSRRRTFAMPTLLEGIAFCQRCGAQHVANWGSHGIPAYQCRNRHSQITRAAADAFVRAKLVESLAAAASTSIDAEGRVFDASDLDEQRALIARSLIVAIRPGIRYASRRPIDERIQVEPRLLLGSNLVQLAPP